MTFNVHEFTSEILQKSMRQKELSIFRQLKELISRGLLVVNEGDVVLTRNMESSAIEYSQTIELVLKDQEYIEKLEKELVEANRKLEAIKTALSPLNGTTQNDSYQAGGQVK